MHAAQAFALQPARVPSQAKPANQCSAIPPSSCSPLSLMKDWSHLPQSAQLLGERQAGKVAHWGQTAAKRRHAKPNAAMQRALGDALPHTKPLCPTVCSPFCCWQL